MAQASDRDPSWMPPPGKVFWVCPKRKRLWYRFRSCRTDDMSRVAWDASGSPCKCRMWLNRTTSELCHCFHNPDLDKQQKVDIWMCCLPSVINTVETFIAARENPSIRTQQNCEDYFILFYFFAITLPVLDGHIAHPTECTR